MQGKSKLIGTFAALFVIIIAVFYMAGSFSDKQAAGLKESQITNYQGERVTVTLQSIAGTEQVPGSVIAKQNTQISSHVMAQVEQLKVRAGDKVAKGDLLIMLKQDDFKAALAQSSANINAVQASLTQAKKQLARMIDLNAQGLVSVSELDDAKAKFENLTANLAVAKQQQTQAQVSLNYTRITAPISGVVVERLTEPGDTATPGKPLITLYNPLQLQLEFNVREQQAVKLRVGDSLNVVLPSLDITTPATVSEIVPVADNAARSLLIRLEADAQLGLMPGLYAQLQLPIKSTQGVLIDPRWVHEFGQLNMVYVLENETLVKRFVRLGSIINNQQHVIAGLKEGDVLAVDYIPSQSD
ncbi:efflux RND transporter periplasmic adaptor subunit [Pseudoalteromonas sp. SCSIO 43095]|uniref:efflux RND transporter periplasmic adaptor subunit n=1 Tax=Pseudoalteromonas TaxID=53246 RepID=UPI00202BABEC|nr:MULTISPECIES: efflux RND transporter periplasmic adaptor subunit [unclassified Pseudoalteromonas]MCK8104168.1 efflux RND transporter periplasmic adaptor subunit [Pseudoalteromonas sp. 2CM36K]MDX1360554.1 efflux RND transporter periplasmic adaptor subunit [Pseudoalteromonas tetraodonis]URQ98464.1 efflux RND transporter periplasmic adaptor subunit [Pseudoalteromonas sp. SCSIO 43095]